MCLYWGGGPWGEICQPNPQLGWDPRRRLVTMNMTGHVERQEEGECMALEHGQGDRKRTACNTVFVSCGRWSTAKYLSNKYKRMCTKANTHLALLTGINLNKNNSETGSWSHLLELWSQQSVTEALPDHRKWGKYRFPWQSLSLFSLPSTSTLTH